MNDGLPKLAQPAFRALAGAGIETIQDLGRLTERELRNLHGMGPNTIAKLLLAMEGAGVAFAPDLPLDKPKQ